MKTTLPLVLIGWMALAGGAQAQYLTGTLTGEPDPNGPPETINATVSSMQLSFSNIVQSASGSFVGVVPDNTVVGTYGRPIDGLSTTPTAVSIDDFFYFLTPVSPGRFTFNLATLTEDSYDSGTGQALFTGTGTIVDSTGAYQDTPGDLTVTFSSSHDYTFSLEAVPEPATLSIVGAGLLGLLALRWRWG